MTVSEELLNTCEKLLELIGQYGLGEAGIGDWLEEHEIEAAKRIVAKVRTQGIGLDSPP